jgi:hypothetical protein
MSSAAQSLERRFGGSRPGLTLVGIEEAAIPVTWLQVDVLAQERRNLPVTEGYALRFVEKGVTRTEEIAAFLGLEESHVIEAAAAQVSEGNLRRRSSGNLELTSRGLEIARTLEATQAVERPLPVAFDRLTWKLVDYSESSLIEKKVAEARGMLVLPADRNARIGLGDVPATEFTGSRFSASIRPRAASIATFRHCSSSMRMSAARRSSWRSVWTTTCPMRTRLRWSGRVPSIAWESRSGRRLVDPFFTPTLSNCARR